MHDHSSVDRLSPADQKIALYRSLFRGRDDVYARRFESQSTGKSGLTTACSHEWVRGICEKPRIRCRDCARQRWIPVSDDVIRWHLTGRDDSGRDFAMGIYPLGLDEKCWFLAMNFAELDWKDNVRCLLDTCHQLNIPVAVQRARSGQGGHLWWFFAESVPAVQARKLGCHLITEAMCHRPQIGLGTYDQLVPIQDTLPREGYGGAIMLPLEKRAREFNNSLFLDEKFEPYADQWRYLSGMRKIERRELDAIATEAARNDRVIGLPTAGPAVSNAYGQCFRRRATVTPAAGKAQAHIAITLDSQIHVDVGGVPAGLRNELLRLAAFQNPEFARAQSMRLSTHGIPRVIGLAEDHEDTVRLPRGCLEDLKSVLSDWQVRASYRDLRHPGRPLPASFIGELTSDQEAAAKKLLQHDIGVLSATTGFGKTVIAAWLIAQREVNTLILVHRRQLVAQWKNRLSEFVQLPSDAMGLPGSKRQLLAGSIDVATIQSLTHRGGIDADVSQYGQVIVDECHHLSARTYQELMNRIPAKYVVGLTATVDRHDGHHPMVMMQCGPVRHHVDPRSQGPVRRMERAVWVRPTQFISQRARHDDLRAHLQQLYTELTRHVGRNQAICEDVLQAVHQGRSPLVLTERNEHLDLLAQDLSPMLKNLIVFRGGMTKSELAGATKRLAAIAADEPRVLLATGRYVGEGFDDARLDTLFLTLPISWSGTLTQYVGRLHRIHDGKSDVRVYDYADLDEPLLARMFDRRCRGYDALGYQLRIPANAVPGWPQAAVVPVEPGWKAEHGATMKRLVRDGIDTTLAESFIQASRAIPADALGADRARSEVEAFLFHRLESIPVTRGRFVLNGRLPIPFGLEGEMEIDLLCTELPIAIEVDGMQHLASVEAYRTDRRKDWLLQEHGYVVLRFLASDVMRDLEMVLDTILRTFTSHSYGPAQQQTEE